MPPTNNTTSKKRKASTETSSSNSQQTNNSNSNSDNAVDDDVDKFDFDMPINYETDVCAMCREGHHYGVTFKKKMEELLYKFDSKDPKEEHFDDTEDFDDDLVDHSNNYHGTLNSPSKNKGLSQFSPSKDRQARNTLQNFKYLDPDCVWFSKYSLALGSRRVFVHYYCALFSPQTRFDGKQWRNVRKEVIRSSGLKCDHCHKKGATLSCSIFDKKKCSSVYHLPCALAIGSLSADYYSNHTKFYCPVHVTERNKINQNLDFAASVDVTKGRECIPIRLNLNNNYCLPCPSSKNDDTELNTTDIDIDRNINNFKELSNFSYIIHNLDSDDVVATSQNVSHIDCCNCVGLCNNVETCSCLKQMRNYSIKGTLVADTHSQIFECNMRCSCSSRRCTNRVVEQGIKFPLELFLGGLGKTTSKYWGLRTLQQDIPKGSFVCEIKGQYVMGSTTLQFFIDTTSDSTLHSTVAMSSTENEYKQGVMKNLMNKYSSPKTVSQEIIRQLLFIYNYNNKKNYMNLTIFPLLLWEMNSLTLESIDQLANEDFLHTNNDEEENYKTLKSNQKNDEKCTNYMDLSCDDDYLSNESNMNDKSSELNQNIKKFYPNLSRIEDFLNKQICLDTRQYGNVSRFIRQLYYNGIQSMESSMSSSYSENVLIRRLVYTDQEDTRCPKLALFANNTLPSGTELIL